MAKLTLNDGTTYELPEVAGDWAADDGTVLVIPGNFAASVALVVGRWIGDKGLADVRLFGYRTTDDREAVVRDLRRAMAEDEQTIARARAEMMEGHR